MLIARRKKNLCDTSTAIMQSTWCCSPNVSLSLSISLIYCLFLLCAQCIYEWNWIGLTQNKWRTTTERFFFFRFFEFFLIWFSAMDVLPWLILLAIGVQGHREHKVSFFSDWIWYKSVWFCHKKVENFEFSWENFCACAKGSSSIFHQRVTWSGFFLGISDFR